MKADMFETDFSQATVITMFLLPDINLKLRPKILDLKPGTRIVSNSFTWATGPPTRRATVTRRLQVLLHRLPLDRAGQGGGHLDRRRQGELSAQAELPDHHRHAEGGQRGDAGEGPARRRPRSASRPAHAVQRPGERRRHQGHQQLRRQGSGLAGDAGEVAGRWAPGPFKSEPDDREHSRRRPHPAARLAAGERPAECIGDGGGVGDALGRHAERAGKRGEVDLGSAKSMPTKCSLPWKDLQPLLDDAIAAVVGDDVGDRQLVRGRRSTAPGSSTWRCRRRRSSTPGAAPARGPRRPRPAAPSRCRRRPGRGSRSGRGRARGR